MFSLYERLRGQRDLRMKIAHMTRFIDSAFSILINGQIKYDLRWSTDPGEYSHYVRVVNEKQINPESHVTMLYYIICTNNVLSSILSTWPMVLTFFILFFKYSSSLQSVALARTSSRHAGSCSFITTGEPQVRYHWSSLDMMGVIVLPKLESHRVEATIVSR